MEIVRAYVDNGAMKGGLTRWGPRRVRCLRTLGDVEEPIDCVVKYRRAGDAAAASTAATVSELICGRLLEAAEIPTLSRRLVHADGAFVASCNEKLPYEIVPGDHFGSVHIIDVEDGPPPSLAHVSNCQRLIDIWAFDTLVCNIDRAVDGNMLIRPTNQELVAADQSDCFGGAVSFADGTWRAKLSANRAAPTVSFIIEAIFKAGAMTALSESIARVRGSLRQIGKAFEDVPSAWWSEIGTTPKEIDHALGARADRLERILDVEMYAGMVDATRGGISVV